LILSLLLGTGLFLAIHSTGHPQATAPEQDLLYISSDSKQAEPNHIPNEQGEYGQPPSAGSPNIAEHRFNSSVPNHTTMHDPAAIIALWKNGSIALKDAVDAISESQP
jgi:hypothetical protein